MPRELHPAGSFPAEVLDHGFSRAATGTPQLWVQFETEKEGQVVGSITAFLPLTEAAAEGSLKKLAAMGFRGQHLADLSDGKILAGRKCVIEVVHETYKGVTRDKVSWIHEEGWVPGPQHDDSVAGAVAKFDGLLQRVVAAAAAPAPVEKVASDSDVPF